MPIQRFIRRTTLKFVLIIQNHYDKLLARATQLTNEEFGDAQIRNHNT